MAAKFRQDVLLNKPFQNVLVAARNIANINRSFTYTGEMPYQNGCQVNFSRGMSVTSWGEKITVTLLPINEYQTGITVYSECALPTQIIDWGKNKENVTNILNILYA